MGDAGMPPALRRLAAARERQAAAAVQDTPQVAAATPHRRRALAATDTAAGTPFSGALTIPLPFGDNTQYGYQQYSFYGGCRGGRGWGGGSGGSMARGGGAAAWGRGRFTGGRFGSGLFAAGTGVGTSAATAPTVADVVVNWSTKPRGQFSLDASQRVAVDKAGW